MGREPEPTQRRSNDASTSDAQTSDAQTSDAETSDAETSDAETSDAKVFGIGLMKTGTTTLGVCLRELGYRHRAYYPKLIRQTHRGEFDDLWAVADAYESFEDHPWPELYRELDERYPDAKFVLTLRRDTDKWFQSLADHARRMGPTAERRIIFGHGWPGSDPEGHRAYYDRHHAEVVEHFRDRPGKLLIVCWETGSTIDDVARFVGRQLPERPDQEPANTPRANASSEQSPSPRFWLRNTVKYVMIGRLGIDPFRRRNFEV